MIQKPEEKIFITLCGPNNIGKTTAAKGVINALNDLNEPTEYLKYPIYDLPSGRRLNAYLREGNPENLTMLEAQKIFAQNRVDFAPTLNTILDATNILAEDYKTTGIAWGSAGGVPLEQMEAINSNVRDADLTLFLDGERFKKSIEAHHLHESDSGLWERSRQVHLQLAEKMHAPVVNANQTEEKVVTDLMVHIKSYLSRRRSLD